MSLIERIKEHNAKRPTLTITVGDVLSNSDDPTEFIVRVLVTAEIADATAAAFEDRKRVIASLPEQQRASIIDDPTLIDDSKIVQMLWRACFTKENPQEKVFPTAASIQQNLTREEVARLWDFYEYAERAASKFPNTLDEPQIKGLAVAVAVNADDPAAKRKLMTFDRYQMVEWTTWLAKDWARLGGIASAMKSDEPAAEAH